MLPQNDPDNTVRFRARKLPPRPEAQMVVRRLLVLVVSPVRVGLKTITRVRGIDVAGHGRHASDESVVRACIPEQGRPDG